MLLKNKLFKSTLSILLVLLLTITCMPISASADTSDTTLDIADIKIEPITITEYTNGSRDYSYNPDTDNWDLEYYRYYPEDIMQFTIILSDGTTIEDYGYNFYYNDEYYYFDYTTDQSYENQWTVGNTYTMEVSLGDITVDVPVTITESPFESIEIEPVSIIEGTCGDYYHDYNPETDDYDLKYYCYEPEYEMVYTVTLKDGTTITDESYCFMYNGDTYYLDTETYQSYENQWTVGNTYTMEVSLGNITVDVPVTITESPFESIEVKPISIMEYTNGDYVYQYNGVTDDFDLKYFEYEPEYKLEYTITLKDGSTIEDNSSWFYYNDKYYEFSITDSQDYYYQWVAGNTYTMGISLLNLSVDVPVTITEMPFESIEVEPITLYEKIDGDYNYNYNPETDDFDLEYFKYYPLEKIKYTITLNDGSTIESIGNSFNYNDEEIYLDYYTDQTYENQWTVGNTYNITVSLNDITVDVPVTITKSPFISIDFEPISIIEKTTGSYVSKYNPETGKRDPEYFEYYPQYKMKYTVTLNDGSTIDGIGNAFKYDGTVYYLYDWSTNQSYKNQWTVGNTYTMTVRFSDLTIEVPVTITESPFKNIDVKPITIEEYTNGNYCYDYNPETDDWDLEYFEYQPQKSIEYTITLNDGSKISGTGYEFEYNGDTYDFNIKEMQSYENQWTAGNTYTMTVGISTISVDVPVTITSSNPTSTLKGDVDNDGAITIKDATIVQEHISRYQTLTGQLAINADVDGSGDINIVDASYIQMHVSKAIDNFDNI